VSGSPPHAVGTLDSCPAAAQAVAAHALSRVCRFGIELLFDRFFPPITIERERNGEREREKRERRRRKKMSEAVEEEKE
jgi:hypothetical protein